MFFCSHLRYKNSKNVNGSRAIYLIWSVPYVKTNNCYKVCHCYFFPYHFSYFQYKYCLGILLFVFPQKAIPSFRSHSKIVVKYLSKNEEEKLFDVAHTKCIESMEAENFVHWRSAFKQYNYCLYCNSLNKNHIPCVRLTHSFKILFEIFILFILNVNSRNKHRVCRNTNNFCTLSL